MVKAFHNQLSLNAGELSPKLWGRPDLAKFSNGLARCANFIPLVQGGVTRRPGTRFVREVKDSTKRVRLIPFVFSRTQAYMIEAGDFYLRFYMNGGALFSTSPNYTLDAEQGGDLETESGEGLTTEQVDLTAAPYELASPYAENELFEIQYAQTADVMFITHPNHPVRVLTRSGHTNWSFAEFEFTNGPFAEYNFDDSHTLTASTETGTATLTSSAALFDAGHVGSLFYLEEEDSAEYSMWEPDKGYTLGDVARWDGNVYLNVQDGGNSGAVAPVHLEGERWDGKSGSSVKWRYLHSGFGVVRITSVASALSATGTVLKRLPRDVVTGTTKNWREGAWSDYRGWPRTVALFEQRAWYAGNDWRPQSLWSTVAGDLFDFTEGTLADDALTWTINSRQANPIQTLSDGIVLNVFAQDREWIGTSSRNGSAITPDDFTIRPNSSYGSSEVIPVTIDATTMFVDTSGYRLVELAYSLESDSLSPNDLTLMAEHITRPGG